jgi:hypothetical protein
MRIWPGVGGACLALAVSGCGSLFGSGPTSSLPEPSGDPTPLAKCRVAASESNPLVTEWPASEKAHLQSLAGRQAVAVEYSGCELRIIPECVLPGTYTWQRTTLATDTLEIRNADELYAKLPIGAVALEGELERSGRLAVQTTVAGQLRIESAIAPPPATEACRRATHVVSAISVGAFKLLSGADMQSGGGVGVAGIGAGARQSQARSVLRTAGDPDKCAAELEDSPNVECASPIQLFLTQLDRGGGAGAPTVGGPAPVRREGDVEISFPAPEDPSESWSLRDADGVQVCLLPCTTRVPRMSGYSLRREEPLAEIPLPAKLSLAPNSRAVATYQAEQGNPTLSKLNFYLMGLPTAAIAVGFGIWGATQYGKECEDALGRPDDCFPGSGTLFGIAGMMATIAGASYWWFSYSHDAELTLSPSQSAKGRPPVTVVFGPGGLSGTF